MTKFKMGDEVVHAYYGNGVIVNTEQQPIAERIYGVTYEVMYGVLFVGNLIYVVEESELEFKQQSLFDDKEFSDEDFEETFAEYDDEELTPQKIKVIPDEDLETIFVQINKKITIAFTVVYNQLVVGIASKSPNDEWDDEQGKALAYFRAHRQ